MVIKDLLRSNVLKFGEFTLTSGRKSNVYVDLKTVCTNPALLSKISENMQQLLSSKNIDFDKIACIELGGVPIAVSLSLKTKKPFVIFRKKRKEHGVKDEFIGDINENEKFLVVDDVSTTGSSVLAVSNKLIELKAKVECILVVVDREEGAKEKIESKGFKFISIFTLSELLKHRDYV